MSDTLIMLSQTGDRFCVDVVEPYLPPYHLFYGNLRELADVLEEANERGLSSESCCRAFHLAMVHAVGRMAASLTPEKIVRLCAEADEPTPRGHDVGSEAAPRASIWWLVALVVAAAVFFGVRWDFV